MSVEGHCIIYRFPFLFSATIKGSAYERVDLVNVSVKKVAVEVTVGFAVAETSYFKGGEHGCPNPVLKDSNPARFFVLPGRKWLLPNKVGSQVKVNTPSAEEKRGTQSKIYFYVEK